MYGVVTSALWFIHVVKKRNSPIFQDIQLLDRNTFPQTILEINITESRRSEIRYRKSIYDNFFASMSLRQVKEDKKGISTELRIGL